MYCNKTGVYTASIFIFIAQTFTLENYIYLYVSACLKYLFDTKQMSCINLKSET